MKSFKSVGHSRPLISCAPPLFVIDDTKVQASQPVVKNKKLNLLSAFLLLPFSEKLFIITFLEKMALF